MRLRYLTACLLAAAPLVAAGAAPAAAAPARPDLGPPTAGNTTIDITLTLRAPAEKQLRSYAASVATPGSNDYRHFLTDSQLRQRFGAPSAAVARVTSWAHSAGFSVGPIDPTGTRLPLTASASTIRRALGTSLYDSIQDGVRIRSATAVRLPGRIAADVAAVTGLNQQAAVAMHAGQATAALNTRGSCLHAAPAPGVTAASCLARPERDLPGPGLARPTITLAGPRSAPLGGAAGAPGLIPAAPGPNAQVCATAWANPDVAPVRSRPSGRISMPLCGYTGPQLRSLYGLRAADDGAGQTIVIVGAFNQPSTLTDANAAFAVNGVPAMAAAQYRVKTYPSGGTIATGCDRSSWALEQALDVQTAHTLAPAARIVYVAAPDCTRLTDTLAQAVADPALAGSVVSNSWGYRAEALSNDDVAATDAILARAAVLGTGTYTASGLYGSATDTGMLLPDLAYPASSPWTTAVGGTTAAIGRDEKLLWQTGWASTATTLSGRPVIGVTGTPVTAAAGGGSSIREPKPAWQPGRSDTMRQVPDLSAVADPNTGLLVGTTNGGEYSVSAVGGTSLATSIVASLAALAQARTHQSRGLLGPLLWHAQSAGATTLADVSHVDAAVWTPEVQGAIAEPSGFLLRADAASVTSGPGWDPVTGLGAPGRTFLTDVG